MPLATLHLISLTPSQSLKSYLALLRRETQPLVLARVIRWIIPPPAHHSVLLTTPWNLFVILLSPSACLPAACQAGVAAHWSVTAGVPSSLVSNFAERNAALLHPRTALPSLEDGALETRPQVASSTRDLELDAELLRWCLRPREIGSEDAVSMFNLLAFHPGEAMHAKYLEYGRAFKERIGRRRGGEAKIVGKVVATEGKGSEGMASVGAREGWEEVALAHYPSARHFAEMLASEDYQEVNQASRVPALRETCILCTCELGLDEEEVAAKL